MQHMRFFIQNTILVLVCVATAHADKMPIGKKAGETWTNSKGIAFVWCPPGKFTAGSPENEPGRYEDEVQREVVIKDGFWISKYEITNIQWPGVNPKKVKEEKRDLPVVSLNIGKDGKRAFAAINKAEWAKGVIPKDWEYNAPTEEQWEYAARAGTNTMYHFGNDVKLLPQYANFGDKSFYDTNSVFSVSGNRSLNDGKGKLAKGGQYQPNAWGIYDIHGNVAEWCLRSTARGGSFISRPENCRIAFRDPKGDRNDENYIGFRFVLHKTPPAPPKKNIPKKK